MVRDDGDLDADEVLKELMESELNASTHQSEILLEEGAEVGYENGEAYVDLGGETYTDAREAYAGIMISDDEDAQEENQEVMTDGGYRDDKVYDVPELKSPAAIAIAEEEGIE